MNYLLIMGSPPAVQIGDALVAAALRLPHNHCIVERPENHRVGHAVVSHGCSTYEGACAAGWRARQGAWIRRSAGAGTADCPAVGATRGAIDLALQILLARKALK